MEYAVVVSVLLGLLLIFIWSGVQEDKRMKRVFRNRLQNRFGSLSEKNYADGRMDSIMSAVEADEYQGFLVDDITWNDLEMDRLFQAMDFTCSAAGEEALYRWLRMPEFDENVLKKREAHFDFFKAHEKERLDYLMFMRDVGRTGKYSIYDYLDYLDAMPKKNCLVTKIIDICMILSLVLGFVCSDYFFCVAISLMLYHGFTYMKQKREVEPYLTTFAYFVRILQCVDKLDSMSKEFKQEFEQELAVLKEEKKQFSSFRRFAFLALNDSGSATGGAELIQMIQVYFNMIFHMDLLKLYSMFDVVKEKKRVMISLLRGLGEIEACVSVVYFRAALDEYCIPTFMKGTVYEAKNLYHPLIENPVKNPVAQTKGMLLTGSNASGKSTFLKAVAINALLAQTIHTVCAGCYKACFFRVYSSMALRDSLQAGESYFIVELKSLKRIFDGAKEKGAVVLCTIDEVLRGTNTAERIGASTELLKALSKEKVLCFAATHDLELTTLLQEAYDNFHFEEMMEGKEIKFPYQLKAGAAKGRNAIKLMEAMGFDKAIVEKAEKLAGGFS